MSRFTKTSAQNGFTIVELMIATSVLSTILLLVTGMMISIGNLYYKGSNQAHVQDSLRSITDEVSQALELSVSASSTATSGIDPSTGASHVPVNVYCIGNTRYSYVLNVEIGQQRYASGAATSPSGATYYDVLWRDVPQGGCVPTQAADLTDSNLAQDDTTAGATNSAELIPADSRLTDFCIGTADLTSGIGCQPDTSGSPYTVSVSIASGSDDLLCDSNYSGDCSFDTVSSHMKTIIANTGSVAMPDAVQIACKGTAGNQFCATASLSTTVASRL